jgi:hypothetical protein
MTSAIWIDANVPMYAFGQDQLYKTPCRRILALAAQFSGTFRIDAEVLQDLVHRYTALKIWNEQKQDFMDFALLMRGATEPVTGLDVEWAAQLVERYPHLSARDLIHLAVMSRVGASHIVSADRGFDAIEGLTRLDPLRVEEWEPLVAGGG